MTPCINGKCRGPGHAIRGGRCRACYAFHKKHGYDRQPAGPLMARLTDAQLEAARRDIIAMSAEYFDGIVEGPVLVTAKCYREQHPKGAPSAQAICYALGVAWTGKNVTQAPWAEAMAILLPGYRAPTNSEGQRATMFRNSPEYAEIYAEIMDIPTRVDPDPPKGTYPAGWQIADVSRRVMAWSPLRGWVKCFVCAMGPFGHAGSR